MVKSQSSVSKFLTNWKIICSAIVVTIPFLTFIYSQFQWKANLEAEQSLQNNRLVELKEDVKRHEQEDLELRGQIQSATDQINNKLTMLSIDVSEIKGQMKIIVPKITEKNTISIKTDKEQDICLNN